MKCACPCKREFEPKRRNQKFVNATHREVARNLRRPRVRVPADSAALLRTPTTRQGANSAVGTMLPRVAAAQTKQQRKRENWARRSSTEFLTRIEVARLLGISAWTLIYWARTHHGPPFVKMARGTVRYPRREVERWLASLPQS